MNEESFLHLCSLLPQLQHLSLAGIELNHLSQKSLHESFSHLKNLRSIVISASSAKHISRALPGDTVIQIKEVE